MVSSGGSKQGLLEGLRVGFGFAGGVLKAGDPLCLAGAILDSPTGIPGDPDGDVVCQALLDALLTAAGLPDLRTVFPPGDPALAAPDSYSLLSQTVTALLRRVLAGVINVNISIVSAVVELHAERLRLQSLLADALQLEPGKISLSFPEKAQAEVFKSDVLVVYVHLLCEVKQPARGTNKLTAIPSQTGLGLDGSTSMVEDTGITAQDADLPERAKKFAKADRSKLPPLPPAPDPREGALLIIYTDGASRGNPGPAASGWVVMDDQGRLVHESGSALGERTNNQAEYLAVLEAAMWVERQLGREFKVQLRSDSELLVKQLLGEYKVKDSQLKHLAMQVMNQLMYFLSFELVHVPRTENRRADALANRVLDGKG